MTIKVLGLLFLFISLPLFAQDNLDEIYHFSEDVRNVVWETAPVPEHFVLSNDDTDRAVAFMELDQELGEYAYSETEKRMPGSDQPCDNLSGSDASKKALASKIKDRKYNLYFTMTFNDAEAVGLAKGFMGKNNYSSFILSQSSNGSTKPYQINTLSKLTQKFKSENPNIEFDSLGIKEKEKLLTEYASTKTGIDIPKGMLMSEIAIDHAINHPGDWKKGMSEIKNDLSFDQKVLVASHLGGKFSDRYNYDRAGGQGRGVVTIEEMLTSVRDGHPGGICRDVSMAQAAILTELGVPKDNVYQIGYSTSGGGHAVVAIQDPNNPKNIVKLNYGYVSESNGAVGSSALIQNTSLPDFGIRNRVYNADGDPVATLPTEIGEILYDSSGGNKGKITPPSRHNINKVGIKTPFGEGQVFTGETSSGDKVVGVTLQKTFNTKYMDTEVAGGIISRDGKRSMVNISQEAVYLRMKNTLNSPQLERGNFSLGSRVGVETELFGMQNQVSTASSDGEKDNNFDVSYTPFIGARAEWNSDSKKTKVISDVEVEGFVVNKNVQLSSQEGMTLAFNKATIKTGMSHEVSQEMKVVGQTAIVIREMGSSAHLSTGLLKETENTNFRAIASYSTPITSDMPAFVPEAQRNLGLSIGGERKKSGIYYNFDYSRDLDNNSNTFGVSAGWKF